MNCGLREQCRVSGVLCVLVGLLCLSACDRTPQKVRRLHEKAEPDSTMLAQMRFNMQMADAADKECLKAIEQDSLRYALDEFGFWYAKTLRTSADTIRTGQTVTLHLVMSELNGNAIADVEDVFAVGSSELPTAISRCLPQMCRGEQVSVIAPWYTAYGIEGTSLVKPYTNLRIQLTVRQ